MTCSTETGARQVGATVQTNSIMVDPFALGQAGVVVSGSVTAAAFTGGGELTFHLSKAPNWSISMAARAVYSPANPDWQPCCGVHIGYPFRMK